MPNPQHQVFNNSFPSLPNILNSVCKKVFISVCKFLLSVNCGNYIKDELPVPCDDNNMFCILRNTQAHKQKLQSKIWCFQPTFLNTQTYKMYIPSVPSIHIMCVFPSEEFLPMEKSKLCVSSSTQPRTWEATNFDS